MDETTIRLSKHLGGRELLAASLVFKTGSATNEEICDALDVSQMEASNTVARLIRKGWVKRITFGRDGKAVSELRPDKNLEEVAANGK